MNLCLPFDLECLSAHMCSTLWKLHNHTKCMAKKNIFYSTHLNLQLA